MVHRFAVWLLCLVPLCGSLWGQIPVFVNEIHYDNTGVDVGEGFEIAGPAGTNLACFRVYLYNGSVPGAAVVYDTIFLSGVIPDQCNGFGTVFFPVNSPAQLQNGSSDGMALIFNPTFVGCGTLGVPTVVQVISYEGGFTAAAGPAIGRTSTDIGVNEVSTTLVGLSLQLTGAGVLYGDFAWAPAAAATPGAPNNGQTFGGTACGTGPVIPTEIRFRSTPSGCLLPGGLFTIEVCGTDAAGFTAISYNSPITISLLSGPGVLSGTVTQNAFFGCATFTGLSLSAAGTYRFRATDGVLLDTSLFVYISPTCATCPNLDAVLVDACGVQEGRNEILFFNSGDFAIPVNANAFTINYGTTPTPNTGYCNTIASNQSYINALNAMAGCSLFHDALSESPIPPNTDFLVMSVTPLTTYNFAAWCGLGSVYVIFSTDVDWNIGTGNWKNCLDCLPLDQGTTPRYFNTNFSGLGGGAGCDFTYSYIPCTDLLCLGDGDGIDFGYGGGTPISSWNECNPTNVLPVAFSLPLQAERDARDVRLQWQTNFESNSNYFEISRSTSALGPFTVIGTTAAAGFSGEPRDYAYRDVHAPAQVAWYRLVEIDANGATMYSQIAMAMGLADVSQLLVSHQGRQYAFDAQGRGAVRLEIFDAAGKLHRSIDGVPGVVAMDLSSFDAGVYFYRVTVGMDVFAGKLPLLD